MTDRAETARERTRWALETLDEMAGEHMSGDQSIPPEDGAEAVEILRAALSGEEGERVEGCIILNRGRGETDTLEQWMEHDGMVYPLKAKGPFDPTVTVILHDTPPESEGEPEPILSCVLGRVGGDLCYHGTRVPVRYVDGIEQERGLDSAHEAYPHIPKERMEAGLRLYRERIRTPPESPERGEYDQDMDDVRWLDHVLDPGRVAIENQGCPERGEGERRCPECGSENIATSAQGSTVVCWDCEDLFPATPQPQEAESGEGGRDPRAITYCPCCAQETRPEDAVVIAQAVRSIAARNPSSIASRTPEPTRPEGEAVSALTDHALAAMLPEDALSQEAALRLRQREGGERC